MSGRNQFKMIQGDSTRDQGVHEYQSCQNLIEDSCPGLRCTVIMRPHTISIRTETLADYYVAASIVRKRTELEVVRG